MTEIYFLFFPYMNQLDESQNLGSVMVAIVW
jgi:hypothetical protein